MLKLNSRKRLSFFLSYILIFLQPLQTFGAVLKPIDVEWTFSGNPTSIRLYQDGIFLCDTYDVSLNMMTCEALIDDQPISFTMTAVTPDGETPPSAAYIVTPPAQDGFGNYIPTAIFSADVTSGDVPLDINFDASSSSDFDGTITSYEWDFGDGDVATGEIITHTFLLPGTYTTTLTAIDNASASSSATTTIIVTDPLTPPPSSNILPTAVINAELSLDSTIYQFDAYNSTDEDGLIVAYQWNFGDGETATSEYVEHNYAVAGTYTVTLTVTDDQDGINETHQTLTVIETAPTGAAPVAEITTGLIKHLIQVTWEYTDTTNLRGYRLYQNGSQICEKMDPATTQMECLTYLENGPMIFALRAVDTSGDESLFSETMTYAPSTTPSTTEGDAPLAVFFNGGNSSDADGPIASYLWDFGDGSIAETSAAEHTFSIAGDYTVNLTVTDTDGNESTTSTVIKILGNLPPVASNSTLNATEDTPAQGTFLASDVDGDPLTYAISLNGSKGSATITNNSTGTFTYTPAPNANGTDSINFYASDESGLLSNVGVVTVNIAAVNDSPTAQNLSLTTSEDTAVNGIISVADPDGEILTYSIITNGSLGNATITNANTGAFTYTPHTGVSGNDSFTISASDGNLYATASVSITIIAVNNPPVAVDDTATTTSNTTVTMNVLTNDSDPDGDTMTITAVSAPANGSAVISGSTILYTPTSNFSGEDSFTYTVSDNQGEASNGTVNVTITADQTTKSLLTILITFNWDFDATTEISGFNIYQNNNKICETNDPTARQLTCEIPLIDSPATFTLTNVDLNGIESEPSNLMNFDPNSMLTNYRLVTLSWDYNNDAETAGFRVYMNSTPICETYNSLVRDISCLIPATEGTMEFSLTALDINNVESTIANILKYEPYQEPVNTAPVADNTAITILQDELYNDTLDATDSDGDALHYSIIANGSLGTAEFTDASAGIFTYTPHPGVYGTDTFTFMVNDGIVNSNIATATVTIMKVNHPPVAQTDAVEIDKNTHVTILPLTNDSDADGDQLSITYVSSPLSGTAVINGSSVIYTPRQDFVGTDSFIYSISDGNNGTASGSISVTVNSVNIPPTTTSSTISTIKNKSFAGSLYATDEDGDTLQYIIVANGTLGTTTITNTSTGAFTYTPKPGKIGTDTFTYKANDGTADSNISTVTVIINAKP